MIGICLEIRADVITVLHTFGTYTNTIDTIITIGDMCTAMIWGVCFACYFGAVVVKMGIANTGCDLALSGFCTNAVAPIRNGSTVHSAAMFGIVGFAGIDILIESGHA